jgi:hypothetical protein
MRISKYVVTVIAAASMMFAGTIEPAAAAALPAPGGDPVLSSCDSPPDTPDATQENAERFVDLWMPRMKDQEFISSFIREGRVPDDIRAEGFHSMNADTQFWLASCLIDHALAESGETPTSDQRNEYVLGANLAVFGQQEIEGIKEELASETGLDATDQGTGSEVPPVQEDMTSDALQQMSDDLLDEPSLTSEEQPRSGATAPEATVEPSVDSGATRQLRDRASAPAVEPDTSEPKAVQALPMPTPLALPTNLLQVFPIPQLLAAIDALLQLIARIQGVLFTLPVLNIIASVFYKICAESPSMPLKCSISLPIGVPIPADVNGDNLPDVTGWLTPLVGGGAVGAKFQVQRLFPNRGKLPAHVYAVYDPPVVKKRIQFGYDGRTDTLANRTTATFKLHNVLNALTGDINVTADVATVAPGASQALTFAIKSLVGGSAGVPAAEEDPLTGAVQMTPVPEQLDMNARLIHTTARDQDIFKIGSSTPTKVDAVIDQATTTTSPKSNRRFTATVDKLPTSVTVDLVRDGETQTIDYRGSAPIDLVRASDKAIGNVAEPDSYTESIYEVKGVPTHVNVRMQGARDITYTADAKIPEVSFQTNTLETGVLQQHVSAQAHQIPKSVHVTNLTTEDQTAFTYDADSELQDVILSMYDLNEADETNLQAKATGIPVHLDFTQTKSTGVYDFNAPGGIDLIEASLSRNGGALLPMPGQDHVTVRKVGDAIGLDLRLSGFASAHFDGSEDTTVALGLSPGGQSFDAIADLDDPNVLATAHVGALPTDLQVTLDPADGAADYTASSIIPLLQASFTDRDTEMYATAELRDLPKNIGLTFNTSGATPEVTYDADSRLGSIDVTYSEKPGGLGIHGLISDLPEYVKIGGIDPIVFDARTSSDAESGSSHLGQVAFQYATDGVFATPPTGDDHVYLDTVGGTHASLQYSGLRLLSVDTSDEELHAEVRNTSPRLFRAYLTTPTLTLEGLIDRVPAEIRLHQVGNTVTYDSSSTVDRILTDLARSNGDTVTVDIRGVPEDVSVLFDGANAKLGWTASAATGSISALVHLTPDTIGGSRPFDAGLTITSIPTQWDASWADGNVLFQAPEGIGSIEAKVTNHGTYHTLSGDHLTAYYREGSEDLDASLKISNLRKASFTKLDSPDGGGFEAALQMGNHGTFSFGADVVLDAGILDASGQFSNLPADLTLRSDGGRITYSGDTNPDLTLSVNAGTSAAALAATPTPPSVHGVSVRDGASGADRAVRARLHLTGLPTGLDLNSPAGTYEVTGYAPSDPTLVVDVALTTIAPQPLELQVQQVVPVTPVDFEFGPFTTTRAADGTSTLNLVYTSSKDLGSLTANARYGTTAEAKLVISAIPRSITVTGEFGKETKHVNVTMDHGIAHIGAWVKAQSQASFMGSVDLYDVPSAVDILIGKESGSEDGTAVTTPQFTMTASQPGLDIRATAAAELFEPMDIRAAANLVVDDLGEKVTGNLEGTRLNVTSTPQKTGKLLLSASGHVNVPVDLGFTLLNGFVRNTGSLDIDIDIKQLTLGFENASTLQLDLGVTTGLKGDYSTFTFGEDTKTVVTVEDSLRLVADLPDIFVVDLDLEILGIPPTTINFENVISSFRLASNKLGEIFSQTVVDILCCDAKAKLYVRPFPERTTDGPEFTVEQPPSDGVHEPAWLITPNLNLLGASLPMFIVDIVAYFASPYGNDLKADLVCDVPGVDPFSCLP